jgi:hypothetical protein
VTLTQHDYCTRCDGADRQTRIVTNVGETPGDEVVCAVDLFCGAGGTLDPPDAVPHH